MAQWKEISEDYDDPQSYGRDASHYGKGRYPPDWKQRRRVVWEQQSNCCGRCGRLREEVYRAYVHHILPLSKGGTNALNNLVGLCGDCHALMHPLMEDIRGTYFQAPIFPASNSVAKVATVRSKRTRNDISSAVKTDLGTLERLSSPDTNKSVLNNYTYAIGAAHARKLPDHLTEILQKHGVIAESSGYLIIKICVKLRGIRGILSNYTPDITVQSDGALVEWSDWTGRWRTLSRRVRVSEDTTNLTLHSTDGTGTTEKSLSLDSRTTSVTVTARPPSLWG